MIRHFLVALAFAALCAVPARAAAPADADAKAIMATINGFNDAMNKGDFKSAATAYADSASIIDEIAPYHWSGAHAFDEWVAAFVADAKVHPVVNPIMKLSAPRHLMVEGGRAYLVLPALFTFKANGKPVREAALLTYAMAKVGADWKIAAWTWARK